MTQPQTPLERAVARARAQAAPPPRSSVPSPAPLRPTPPSAAPGMPAGVARFSWAALVGGPVWAVAFRVWWGLGSMLPFIGLPILVILAFRGREAAWKTGRWSSVQAFDAAQQKWLYWTSMLSLALFLVLAFFGYLLLRPMLADLQELQQVMEIPEG